MPELSRADFRKLINRLGSQPDTELQREFNISRQRIFQLREERNIPPYKSKYTATISSTVTAGDVKKIKRAMKKTGDRDRSQYIRGAVRKRNKEVLG